MGKKYLILFLLILILIPLGFISIKNPSFVKPKIYNVVAFSSRIEQVITSSDILIGKGIPNAKVSISITPGEIKQEVKTGVKGDWSYTIPKNAKSGSYNLTVLILDTGGSIASIKSYPIKIEVREWKLPKFNFNVWAQSSNTATYVDPTSGNLGQTFTVTATGIPSCSTNYNFNPGGGLSGCRGGCGQGGVTDGCTCSGGNPKDSNACWWRWTCNTTTLGNFTAGFNASGNACFSSANYSVNAPQDSSQPSGQISATPSHFELQQGQIGTTTITWSGVTGAGQVRVYEPTGNTTCSPTNQCTFGEGSSGSKTLTAVETGHTYIFNLYSRGCTKADCSDRPLLGSAIVTTSVTCSANNRTCPAGLVCNAAQFSSGYCVPQTPTPTPPPPEPRELEALGSEYQDWVARMKRLSIYPAKDIRSGEIVFVSREDFQEQVCNNDPSCISPNYDAFIDGIRNNNFQYIIALGNHLRQDCYVAFEALRPYFPNAEDFFEGQRLNLFSTTNFSSLTYMYQEPNGCIGRVKHEITEEDLSPHILATARDYSQTTDDPNHDFFTTTETATLGLLPASVILRLYALNDGYKGDGALIADTGFWMANFIPIAKVGGAVRQVSRVGSHNITSRTSLELSELSARLRPIREGIQSTIERGLRRGEKIPQAAVKSEVDNAIERSLREIPISQLGRVLPQLPSRYPTENQGWWATFIESVSHGASHGFRMNSGRVRLASAGLIEGIRHLAEVGKINLNLSQDVAERFVNLADDGWVLAINDSKWSIYQDAGAEGVSHGRTILLPTKVISDDTNLNHELIHRLSVMYTGRVNVGGRYWNYINRPGQGSLYDLFMSWLYEIATEDLRIRYELAKNGIATGNVYIRQLPEFTDSIRGLIAYLQRYSNNRLTWADVDAFAITQDDTVILRKIFGSDTRDQVQRFVNLAFDKIDPAKVDRLYRQTLFRPYVPPASALAALASVAAAVGFNQSQAAAGVDLITPAIQQDEDILTSEFRNELENDSEVTIIYAPDETESGDNINVSVLETESGLISSHVDQLKEVFTIQSSSPQGGIFKTAHAQGGSGSISALNALPAQEIYPQTYQISIPDNTNPGAYCLKAYLYKQGSDEILDESDCHALAIEVEPPKPSPPPLEVTSIKINGQDMDLNTLILNLHLPGIEGQTQSFAIPVEVTYSDGDVRYLAYNFNYTPPTPTPTPTPTPQLCTYSETPQGCSYGGNRTCTGSLQDGVCKYDPDINPNCNESCNPPPAPQCTTSCGRDNGQNCTNKNKADTECADYYEDESTCSFTNAGPRGDGCIP